jgi:hypothetical protein
VDFGDHAEIHDPASGRLKPFFHRRDRRKTIHEILSGEWTGKGNPDERFFVFDCDWHRAVRAG